MNGSQTASLAADIRRRQQPAGSPLWRKIKDKAPAPLFAVVLLAYWEFHVWFFQVEALLLPPPSKIAISFWSGMTSGLFLHHFQHTLIRALSGFCLAAAIGIGIGAAISQFKIVEKTIYPWVVALQTVPKIAIAPLLLVWFGYGTPSKVVTAALVALFPVLVNTVIGLRSCDQGKLDLMRSLNASRWETFRMVQLPNALPFIFAGLNVAIVFAILGAIVGEFVGSQEGIGFLILDANYQLLIPRVFALLLLLAMFGITCFLVLQFLHRKLVFWNRQAEFASA